MSEVCIIGAGVSGIISAKLCLDQGLKPQIFEKSDSIGGVWKNSESGIGTWNSLEALNSKSFTMISDHPWPKSVPEFPSRGHMLDYYTSYAEKNGLFQYINFNTSVESLSEEGEGYSVILKTQDSITTRNFKSVIIGTGFNSKINESLPGNEKFSGVVLHSGYYREPSIFQGKRVVIIGNSYSSSGIASEACTVTESVSLIYRSKTFFNRKKNLGVPFECFMFSIANRNPGSFVTTRADNEQIMKRLEQVYGNPGDINEQLRITEEEVQRSFQKSTLHSDRYLDCLKEGKIQLFQGSAVEFSENGVILSDGREIPADVVVLCTGFYQNYDYLSENIRRTLNHDPKLQKNSLTLFRSCIHPAFPGLAFVGNFHGPFPAKFEIQSHLALQWITGQLQVSQEELWEGVRLEERCRTELKEATFIYNVGRILLEYVRILRIEIDYQFLESLGYCNGPYCSVFFWKDRPGQEEMIREFVKDIKESYPHYDFSRVTR
jgi:dimethylaniline monooxygenase (N-oxide forming)